MKTIKIESQEQWDNLPSEFDEYIELQIHCNLIIRGTPKNSQIDTYGSSQVYAYGSSRVSAHDSSRVSAHDSSRVSAHDSSRVSAHDSSRVSAHDSSRVYAYDSSRVDAYGSSRVYAYDSSRVYAYDSSRVYAYDSSRVSAHDSSQVSAHDSSQVYACEQSIIRLYSCEEINAYDNVTIYNYNKLELDNLGFSVNVINDIIVPTFNQWLERGIVCADGIKQELVSQKTIGDVSVFEVLNNGKPNSFVVKKGEKTAHGETIEQAKNDLKYKLANRDASEYESWKVDDVKSTDELIECYMAITGACSMGTKMFCERLQLKDEYKISEIIEMTIGNYGNSEFKNFFKGN
jgi:hypothetical protein